MEKLLIFLVIFAISKILEMVNNARAAREVRSPEPVPTMDDIMQPRQASSSIPIPDAGIPPRKPRERTSNRRSQNDRASAGKKTRPSGSTQAPARSRPDAGRPTGAGVRKHVESYISDHVQRHMDSQVDESVRQNITLHVQQHIGTGLSADAEQSTAPQSIQDIRGLLHNVNDVRKAVLLNEILTRPRCLTRPR